MKNVKNILSVAILLISSLFLAACSNSGGAQSPTQPSTNPPTTYKGQAAATTTEPSANSGVNSDVAAMLKDEKDYNWVIIVQDSSTIKVAPGETTVTMDLKATNSQGGIMGKYSGTSTAKSVSVNPAYGATATSDLKTGTVSFSIGPVLAPLVPENNDNKLPLAPLVQPGNEPDYEGDGTFALSNPTGTVQIQGMGIATQKQHTSTSSYPLHFSIKGTQVRMTMKTPQGDIYFDGLIRGEGKK